MTSALPLLHFLLLVWRRRKGGKHGAARALGCGLGGSYGAVLGFAARGNGGDV
jgi:hypothetical protein